MRDASARLKFGMIKNEIKSVTFPNRIRSPRFPSAPPRISAKVIVPSLDSFCTLFAKRFPKKIIAAIESRIIKIRGKGIPKASCEFSASSSFKIGRISIDFARNFCARNFEKTSKNVTSAIPAMRRVFCFCIKGRIRDKRLRIKGVRILNF